MEITRSTNLRSITLLVTALSLVGIAKAAGSPAVEPIMAPSQAASARPASQAVTLPAVRMVRDDGRSVDLRAELDDGRPVYLNFIFTSCPGICPASSQVFAQLQRRLAASGGKAHLVSISLDPDYDTPSRLREYAARFHAGKAWQHYTGTVQDSVAVQKAFGAWRGDKMNHEPVTFFRARPGASWERIGGFATAPDLLQRLVTAP